MNYLQFVKAYIAENPQYSFTSAKAADKVKEAYKRYLKQHETKHKKNEPKISKKDSVCPPVIVNVSCPAQNNATPSVTSNQNTVTPSPPPLQPQQQPPVVPPQVPPTQPPQPRGPPISQYPPASPSTPPYNNSPLSTITQSAKKAGRSNVNRIVRNQQISNQVPEKLDLNTIVEGRSDDDYSDEGTDDGDEGTDDGPVTPVPKTPVPKASVPKTSVPKTTAPKGNDNTGWIPRIANIGSWIGYGDSSDSGSKEYDQAAQTLLLTNAEIEKERKQLAEVTNNSLVIAENAKREQEKLAKEIEELKRKGSANQMVIRAMGDNKATNQAIIDAQSAQIAHLNDQLIVRSAALEEHGKQLAKSEVDAEKLREALQMMEGKDWHIKGLQREFANTLADLGINIRQKGMTYELMQSLIAEKVALLNQNIHRKDEEVKRNIASVDNLRKQILYLEDGNAKAARKVNAYEEQLLTLRNDIHMKEQELLAITNGREIPRIGDVERPKLITNNVSNRVDEIERRTRENQQQLLNEKNSKIQEQSNLINDMKDEIGRLKNIERELGALKQSVDADERTKREIETYEERLKELMNIYAKKIEGEKPAFKNPYETSEYEVDDNPRKRRRDKPVVLDEDGKAIGRLGKDGDVLRKPRGLLAESKRKAEKEGKKPTKRK